MKTMRDLLLCLFVALGFIATPAAMADLGVTAVDTLDAHHGDDEHDDDHDDDHGGGY